MKYPTAWPCGTASRFQLWVNPRGVWNQRGPYTRQALMATGAQMAEIALALMIHVVL